MATKVYGELSVEIVGLVVEPAATETEYEEVRKLLKRLRQDVRESNCGPLGAAVHDVIVDTIANLEQAIAPVVEVEIGSYGISIGKLYDHVPPTA